MGELSGEFGGELVRGCKGVLDEELDGEGFSIIFFLCRKYIS
jgi:hypothetical protein